MTDDWRYAKPEFPQGWFMLVHEENGFDEGPYNDTMLESSELEGHPWALISVGSPTVLRLLQQAGDLLTLERKTGKGDWVQYQVRVKQIEKHGKGWRYVEQA